MSGMVVGVDGSEGSAEALRWAVEEARLHGSSLTAVMAWTLIEQRHPDISERINVDYQERDALAALDVYIERALGASAGPPIEKQVIMDRPARALLDASADASLLVVGSRGMGGFRGLLLGSVSQHCLHHATVPTAIVRPPGTAGSHARPRIVVGVDGSESASNALRWAVREARLRDAGLDVVHSWPLPALDGLTTQAAVLDSFEMAGRVTLDSAVDSVDTSGLAGPVNRVLSVAGPARAILDIAEEADLVVVGSRGHGGFVSLVLGSVGLQVTQHANCTVVVIRGEK